MGWACPVFTTVLLLLAAVSISLGSPGFPRSYGYDAAGRALILIAGNGQVTENDYDGAGRLLGRALYRSLDERTAGGKLAEFGWGHDLSGNVTSQWETWPGEQSRGPGMRTTAMTYDGAYRLLTETIHEPGGKQTTTTYAYDDANNRNAKTVTVGGVFDPATQAAVEGAGAWTYTYNTANQLTGWEKRDSIGGTQVKSATLIYDANGNRLTQTVAGGADHGSQAHSPSDLAPGTTAYTWDSQNRLLGVTMPDGSEHAYTYDYRTRRIGTSQSLISDPSSPAQHTTISFSGGLSAAEWESTTTNPEPGTTNPPSVEYTRGPDMGGGVGGLLYTVRSTASSGSQPSALGSTLRYNLSNGRGDIVAQSDPAAALTWTASYEAHGRRTTETGTNADKQRANTKDEDPTGLLNEGFRYRDLETGVWLSRDPAGFVDGPNLYAYVKQNPWSKFAPEGLWSWSGFGKGALKAAVGVAIAAVAVTAIAATGGIAAVAIAGAVGASAATAATAGTVVSGGVYCLAAAYGGYQTGVAGYEAITGLDHATGAQLSDERRSERGGEAAIGLATLGLAKVKAKSPTPTAKGQQAINRLIVNRSENGLPGNATTSTGTTGSGATTPVRTSPPKPTAEQLMQNHKLWQT